MSILKTIFLYLDTVWMLLIIITNLSTIGIVHCKKSVRSTINNFLLCLFVNNLLYGFSVVFRVVVDVNQSPKGEYEYYCLLRFVVSLMPALGILYSLTAIIIDRYIAIFYPLRYLSVISPLVVKVVTSGIRTLSLGNGISATTLE